MTPIIAKLLPLFLFPVLGFVMQKRAFLTAEMVQGLKKMLLYFGLCPMLFLSFLNIRFQPAYLLLLLTVVGFLVVLYVFARGLTRTLGFSRSVFPFFVPTFTVGFLGMPLYSTVFGMDGMEYLAVFSLGHELFMWIIFYTLLGLHIKGEGFSPASLKRMIRSPFLLAVFSGLFLNLTGLAKYFQSVSVLAGVYAAMEMMAGITLFLVLFLLGYELVLEKRFIKKAFFYALSRRILVFSLGYLLFFLLIRHFLPLTPAFRSAWFVFLNLPPVFTLPVYMEHFGSAKEKITLISNSIVLDSFFCFGMFFLYVFFKTGFFG